ncbi:MAG: methyl-accepting chemotaxis protein [Motiliproteus sp.]
MRITITQRIGAGFTLLVVLMLVMIFSSYRGLLQLNDQVDRAGEQIAPMLVSSGVMGVSLLSANKTMMQFLASSDLEQMVGYQTAFKAQRAGYQGSQGRLKELAVEFPTVSALLQETDASGSQFLGDADTLFEIHTQFIKAAPAYISSQEQLRSKLATLKSDLEDLANYGDDHNEISAATTLAAQLAALNDSLRMLNTQGLESSTPNVYSDIDQGLKAMGQRIEKLAATNATTAEDLAKSLHVINTLIAGEQGLLPLTQQQQQRKQQNAEQLAVLTTLINTSTSQLNQLMGLVEEQARTEQVMAGESAATAQQTSFAIGFVSILLAVITGLSVCRSIRRPLKEIMSMLRVMADGDMKHRIKIVSKDEFADLSIWVNQLAEQLTVTIGAISSSSTQVAETITDTAELSDKSRTNMQRQSEQTAIVVSSMNEMVGCVKEVAKGAEQAQQAIIEIDQSANVNRTTMDKNIQMIQTLASKIKEASEVIDRLNDRSNTIGQILEVIRSIAEQTNLLALNAAIEAARAGDQGRGFAVVADEVRTLASRTQNSTAEIQTIIEQLQQGAGEAVTIMDSSSDEVKNSVTGIEKAGCELSAMVNRLEDIRGLSEHIATAAEEQSYTCAEIDKSVQQIATMTEECSNDSVRIVEKGDQMVALAEQQQQLVGKFILA